MERRYHCFDGRPDGPDDGGVFRIMVERYASTERDAYLWRRHVRSDSRRVSDKAPLLTDDMLRGYWELFSVGLDAESCRLGKPEFERIFKMMWQS